MNYFEPDGLSHMEREEQLARERAAAIHDREMEEEETPSGADDPSVAEDPWKREREHIEQERKEQESEPAEHPRGTHRRIWHRGQPE